jgi:putative membrane protein insertion efficiency factor
MRHAAVALVHVYRFVLRPLLSGLSPGVPGTPVCKYEPSCSQYALDVLRGYGLIRGCVLIVWRLLRCNPWSHGGVDRAEDQRLFRRARQAP